MLFNLFRNKKSKPQINISSLSREEIATINIVAAASEVFQNKVSDLDLDKIPDDIRMRIVRINDDIKYATKYIRIVMDKKDDSWYKKSRNSWSS